MKGIPFDGSMARAFQSRSTLSMMTAHRCDQPSGAKDEYVRTASCAVKDVRIWIVGLGTVGQWLLRALHMHAARLEGRYGFVPRIVGVANARDGFIYDGDGTASTR